jgi:hypothetical protein
MPPSDETVNPKRWKPRNFKREGGRYNGGITNPTMLLRFGEIIATWPHVEQMMVDVLDMLIFSSHDYRRTAGHMPGQQIFRSISANGVRIKLLRNLLTRFPGNVKKDALFDQVIHDFQTLVNQRNDYVHGLWWTFEDGRVFLQTENIEEYAWGIQREVTLQEFSDFLATAAGIRQKTSQIHLIEYEASETKKEVDARIAASKSASSETPPAQRPSDIPKEVDPPANNQQDT